MTADPIRDELLSQLAELRKLLPDWRLGRRLPTWRWQPDMRNRALCGIWMIAKHSRQRGNWSSGMPIDEFKRWFPLCNP